MYGWLMCFDLLTCAAFVRVFSKAVQLDRYNAAAWIGFAHCKSLLDESDPAVAAYRTAARLFPG